ncbi:glycosyltransferase [uncultured Imperialibacter sp.]|uniref:glycosyltransferase n=1 Tax=uncultured Imperialibacter sp. TaxID=1672639 RepID=UPI0030DD2490|tara:strand:- start:58313 stop:59128 length:816 start_codon:yes stop_codon:yes gene_type:complete
MKSSLIISVYKNTADLKVVLDGLSFQTDQGFEIIVSEDGESPEMSEFVASYPFKNDYQHLTQPDVGWRKNQALNNAVRKAKSDYLIFIDGDCVLHHKFIENHHRYASKERILAGKRVKLGPGYSAILRQNTAHLPGFEKQVQGELSKAKKDGAKFTEEAYYINPDGLLGFVPKIRKMHQLKGCNMSFFKEAIERINGFDEDYILPAIGEDIDLTWRFLGMGFKLYSLRNLAVQYHLYHKENWTDQSENEGLMKIKQQQKQFVCRNGLEKME